MIIRVRSSVGTHRIEIDENANYKALVEKIETQVPFSHFILSRDPSGSSRISAQPSRSIKELALKHGDMIYLSSTGKEEDIKITETEPEQIVEDEIDLQLEHENGWISKERKKSHQMTLADLPTPPWEIINVEPWKSEGIKFIPFHAYVRKLQDQAITKGLSKISSSKTINLDQPSYRISTQAQKVESPWLGTCRIDSQSYRHVDHVEFQSPDILDGLIQYWRETGNQRCGYLYGKYIPDHHIPLGIRVSVAAIYEPPQKSSLENVTLENDSNIDDVDAFARLFGLRRVGFIWTDIRFDSTKRIIQNRVEYMLTSSEIVQMAKMQNSFPSPCKQASSGFCGSKFVSVLVTGDAKGQIDVHAFQVSDQCMALVRDSVITFSKDPMLLRLKKTSKRILPDIIYRAKNEYGIEVLKKAEPTFPPEFFIIRLGQGAPKSPSPLFKGRKFPIENRGLIQNINQIKQQLSGPLSVALADFHLLLFLSAKLSQADLKQLAQFVLTNTNEAQVRAILTNLVESMPPSQPSQPVSQPLAPSDQTLIDQLVNMGYSHADAKAAVWATQGISIEAAVEFLSK